MIASVVSGAPKGRLQDTPTKFSSLIVYFFSLILLASARVFLGCHDFGKSWRNGIWVSGICGDWRLSLCLTFTLFVRFVAPTGLSNHARYFTTWCNPPTLCGFSIICAKNFLLNSLKVARNMVELAPLIITSTSFFWSYVLHVFLFYFKAVRCAPFFFFGSSSSTDFRNCFWRRRCLINVLFIYPCIMDWWWEW